MGGLLGFGASAGAVQFLNYLSSNADSVVIGRYIGPAAVGVYNQAYDIFELPLQQLAAPMTLVAVPVLSRITDNKKYEEYVLRAQLTLTYVLGGSFSIVAAVSVPLFAIILGPHWHQVPYVFAVLVPGGLFQALGYVYYWIFISRALTAVQLKISALSRILMVVFLVIGLKGGTIGVAAGASAGIALNWILLTVFALPKSGLNARRISLNAMRQAIPFAVIFGVVFPLSLVTRNMGPYLQLLALSAAVGALLIAAFGISRQIRSDVSMLLDTLRRARGMRGRRAA
jgi:PST family polysaccharide transporter